MEERSLSMMKIFGAIMENIKTNRLDIYMKKTLIYLVTAIVVMAGCKKFKPDSDPLDDGKLVKIEFASNVVNVRTKASLTGLNGSHDLYIWSEQDKTGCRSDHQCKGPYGKASSG